MPLNGVLTEYDDLGYPQAAAFTKAVPAGTAANTVVRAVPGRLCRVVVTGLAGTTTGNTTIYDSASGATGTPLLTLPNAGPAGTVYPLDVPTSAGITVAGTANSPALTIGYA